MLNKKLNPYLRANQIIRTIMAKGQDSKKSEKKEAAKTPKEKKA
ncbi:MAG: hypothetical protein ACI837_001984, partial [Crocinitomicaceae bacterium]